MTESLGVSQTADRCKRVPAIAAGAGRDRSGHEVAVTDLGVKRQAGSAVLGTSDWSRDLLCGRHERLGRDTRFPALRGKGDSAASPYIAAGSRAASALLSARRRSPGICV